MIKLKTERLILRHLHIDDVPDFFSYRSNPVANRFQGWIPKQEQDALDFIKNRITGTPDIPDTWIQFAIILAKDKKVIGDLGVYFHPEDPEEVKLGYTLDKDYWGHGYATEALRLLIDHLMIAYGKTKFVALISPENTASIQLIKRLGFIQYDIDPDSKLRDLDYPDDLAFVLNLNND